MIATDRDALICDMAEVYGVFDLYALPVRLLATLAAGLREDSRIMLAMAGMKAIPPMFTLVRVADAFTVLLQGMAGKKAGSMPELYGDIMAGKQQKTKDTAAFDSIEEFEEARRRILEKIRHG